MAIDYVRLKNVLNRSQVRTEDNSLYQVIDQLINGARDLQSRLGGVESGKVAVSGAPGEIITLDGVPDYITKSGSVITRNPIDLSTDVTNRLSYANLIAATAARLIGATGAGNFGEIPLGTGLAFSGGNLINTLAGLPVGTAGDILYFNGTIWTQLSIGANGYYLKSNGSVPDWVALSGLLPSGSDGDILYYSGGTWQKLTIGSTNQVIAVAGGVPDWTDLTALAEIAAVATLVYKSSDYTLPDLVETAISFDTEVFDDTDMWVSGNPTKIIVSQDGNYIITCGATVAAASLGLLYIILYNNGVEIARVLTNCGANSAIDEEGQLTCVTKLVENDEIVVKLYWIPNVAGTDATIKGGQTRTFFQIVSTGQTGSVGGGDLTINIPDDPVTPVISIVGAAAPATVNFSTEGTEDWLHLNGTSTFPTAQNPPHTKALGIKTIWATFIWIRRVAGNLFTFGSAAPAVTTNVSDSTGPALTAYATGVGVTLTTAGNLGNGFCFAAPADKTTRVLRLYAGVFSGEITVTCRLSDGSLADVTSTYDSGAGVGAARKFTITYNASLNGKFMIVTVLLTINRGSTPNVNFVGATLATS